jgi:hypothetical protein
VEFVRKHGSEHFTREGLLVLLATILVPIAGFQLAALFC